MLKVLTSIAVILFVGSLMGCATIHSPSTIAKATDYELCRLSLLRPLLQSNQNLMEADRQIALRKVDCTVWAGYIFQQQQEGLRQLQRSADYLNESAQRNQSGASVTPRRSGITCFKTREWKSGSLKNCAYNCMGSEAINTVSAAEFCPVSIYR